MTDSPPEAASGPPPAWLETLFPHRGAPDAFAQRLQRIEATALDVDGEEGGQATCRFIYPGIDGNTMTGTARFYLPPVLAVAGRRVPLLHVAGYELSADGAMGYLRAGIAVATVHGHALNPLVRGPKLEWALLHIERRLSFVDDARVFVQGGSAGGYVALMAAAETFPLVCAIPIVPVVNWGYNAAYLARSRDLAASHRDGSEAPWLPVLAMVASTLGEQTAGPFGVDTEAPVYAEMAPVRWIDGITARVLTAFTTADLLVPIEQVSARFVRPFDRSAFPDGFTQDPADLLRDPEHRVRLLDVLDDDQFELFVATVPEGTGRYQADLTIDGDTRPLALPFSRTRQWSIVVLDEGAPEPQVGHQKFGVNLEYDAYWRWALARAPETAQLTPAKLARMMRRYQGIEPVDFEVAGAHGPYPARLLDFPQAERADVLRGLLTFARHPPAAVRLAEVYATLPPSRKVLGESLGDGSAESVRRALERAAESPPDYAPATGVTTRIPSGTARRCASLETGRRRGSS